MDLFSKFSCFLIYFKISIFRIQEYPIISNNINIPARIAEYMSFPNCDAQTTSYSYCIYSYSEKIDIDLLWLSECFLTVFFEMKVFSAAVSTIDWITILSAWKSILQKSTHFNFKLLQNTVFLCFRSRMLLIRRNNSQFKDIHFFYIYLFLPSLHITLCPWHPCVVNCFYFRQTGKGINRHFILSVEAQWILTKLCFWLSNAQFLSTFIISNFLFLIQTSDKIFSFWLTFYLTHC